MPGPVVADTDRAWRASGLADLSGPPPGGRADAPPHLIDGVGALGRRITAASTALGRPVVHDWACLLTEKARADGLTAGGRTSSGGTTHLLRCRDGWIAVALGRPDDRDLLPAWAALAGTSLDDGLEVAVAAAHGADLVDGAALLGLPVGRLSERIADPTGGVIVTTGGPAVRRDRPLTVVDLSALWAGPRCAALLADAGAEVVKVESTTRPDRLREGSPVLYERLNGTKSHLALDLGTALGRERLGALVADADVVVTAARHRAIDHLGLLDPLGRDGVWVSITGHGLGSPRVAFGDDAAVAGGLVVHDEAGPWFCGDAIADPLAGLAGAAAALELVAEGRTGTIDVAMAGVAASMA